MGIRAESLCVHPDLIVAYGYTGCSSIRMLPPRTALLLHAQQVNSGCGEILPIGHGGGIHNEWAPWAEGWPWMKR